MSHVAKVKLRVRNLPALKRAAEKLGLKFNEGQKTYKWWGHWVNDYSAGNAAYHHGIDPKDYGKCEHAISIPNDNHSYEVGVVAEPGVEGAFGIVWDFYGQTKLKGIIGSNGEKLIEAYAEECLKEVEGIEGINREVTKDGKIVLTGHVTTGGGVVGGAATSSDFGFSDPGANW